ncbi:porin family protein [Rhizobiaceae bacterium BDR2-2]|uniref:Porin family protein n=1 Tax=Ectorhizobium quercum TaxID=2965071 RepID=A0AAE3N7F5_9HYPH|nr:outer membrane protein [Ectorhizobium quercum]MCX8999962.1 porin family protein [Ectorhizobium quercum]
MKSLILTSLIALSASVAMAADVVYEAPQPPVAEIATPVFTWSGPYLGIQGGGSWLDGDFSAAGATASDDFNGGRFGVFGGYQYQFDNNFVLGLEGDVSYDWNENTYLDAVDVGTDWSGSVRAKVGYAIDRALIYATGGWAITRGYIDISGAGEETKTFNGYTVGAGVDYAFTDNIFTKLEYRFNDFGDKNVDVLGVPVNADLKQHLLTVGIGVKF